MEATKQAEEFFKTWTETQTKVWDSWAEAMQASGGTRSFEGSEELRKITFDSWEQSVKNALEAQADWTRILTGSLTAAGLTSGTADRRVLDQVQDLVSTWLEAQKRLWAGWFDMAKRLDVSRPAPDWEKALGAWQETVRKTVEAQLRWFSSQARSQATGDGRAKAAAK